MISIIVMDLTVVLGITIASIYLLKGKNINEIKQVPNISNSVDKIWN